ncbi:MAG: hypothetical protein Q9164_004839 [Protoblastenia rupestris]
MGWLFGSSSSSKPTDSDPFRDLDPSLKEFLVKESPIKYRPAPTPPPPPPSQIVQPSTSQTQAREPSEPKAPSESLYPDGRYAHLWKSYRPLSEVENALKSDQEKLLDVLDGYKARRAQIGRAAVENCVEEQMRVMECYEHGNVKSMMIMCRPEKRAFERCYMMQSRFLKALGYLSSYDRPESVDEQIQMHADKMFHRMLDQEAAIEEAKAAGRPVPEFRSVLSPDQAPFPTVAPTATASVEASTDDDPQLSPATIRSLTPEAAAALRKRLKPLDAFGRDAEERSTMAELEAAAETSREVDKISDERKRKARAERGEADGGEKWGGWFEWLVKGPGK